jgi:hypothetical protein
MDHPWGGHQRARGTITHLRPLANATQTAKAPRGAALGCHGFPPGRLRSNRLCQRSRCRFGPECTAPDGLGHSAPDPAGLAVASNPPLEENQWQPSLITAHGSLAVCVAFARRSAINGCSCSCRTRWRPRCCSSWPAGCRCQAAAGADSPRARVAAGAAMPLPTPTIRVVSATLPGRSCQLSGWTADRIRPDHRDRPEGTADGSSLVSLRLACGRCRDRKPGGVDLVARCIRAPARLRATPSQPVHENREAFQGQAVV